MIARFFQAFGFTVGIIVFGIATLLVIYFAYILAIGLLIILTVYTVFKVLCGLKTSPS